MFSPNDPVSQNPPAQPFSPYDPLNRKRLKNRPTPSKPPRRLGGCLSIQILLLILLIGVGFAAYQHFQDQPPSFLFQSDLLSFDTLLLPGVITVLVLIFLANVALHFRGTVLGKLMAGVLNVMLFTLVGGIILWIVLVNPNIGMTRTAFTRTSVSISRGSTIHFRNPPDGITQILCMGVDQQCKPGNGDPTSLDQGLVIQPGQIVGVVFNTDGNYQITSKTTPHMDLAIHVQESSIYTDTP